MRLLCWLLYVSSWLSTMGCVSWAPHLRRIGLASRYGLFARMTTTRDEVVLRELHRLPPTLAQEAEAAGLARPSGDKHWVELALPYKPGPLGRPPPVLWLHMPRLDWQLWFVALTWARSRLHEASLTQLGS